MERMETGDDGGEVLLRARGLLKFTGP